MNRERCAPHPLHAFLLPGTFSADVTAAFSPCKDMRIMRHRPEDSQPSVYGGPQDHVSPSSTSVLSSVAWFYRFRSKCRHWPFSEFQCGPVKTQGESRGTILFQQFFLMGVTGRLESVPAFTGWETEMSLHSIYNSFVPNWTGTGLDLDDFFNHDGSDDWR